MMTLKKSLVGLIYALTGILLILATTITLIVTTEAGNRLLLNQAHRVLPGSFEYENYSGLLLRDFTLEGLSYVQQGSDLSVRISYLNVRWRPWELLQGKLYIRDFESRGVRLSLPHAETDTTPANQRTLPKQLPTISAPLDLRIDRLEVSDIQLAQGEFVQDIDHVSMRARIQNDTLHLRRFIVNAPQLSIQLHGDVTPQNEYSIHLNNRIQIHLSDQESITVTGNISGSTQHLQSHQVIDGPARAELQLTLNDVLSEELRWSSEIQLEEGARRFFPDVESFLIGLRISGSINHAAGDMRVQGRHRTFGELAPIQGMFQFQGNLKAAEQFLMQIQAGDTHVSLHGNADWQDALRWDLLIKADHLLLDPFVPDIKGQLSFELATKGSWTDRPDIHVDLSHLSGTLQHISGDYDLEAHSQLTWTGDTLSSHDLYIAANNSVITATIDVDWLETMARFRAQGTNLATTSWSIGHLTTDLAIDWSLTTLPTGSIEFENIKQNNLPIVDHLVMRATQENEHYDLVILGAGQDAELDFQVSGAWHDMTWDGLLQQMQLRHPFVGEWQNTRNSQVTLTREWIHVNDFCLRQEVQNSQLCLDLAWHLGTAVGSMNAEIQEISLDLLQPILPDQVRISGALHGNIALETLENRWRVDGLLGLSDSVIALPEQDIALRFRDSDLLRFTGDQETFDLHVELLTADLEGGIRGHLTISDILHKPQIDGSSEVVLENLAFISILIPELQAVTGQLSGKVRYFGDIQQPKIDGHLFVKETTAEIPALGIALNEIQATLTTDDFDEGVLHIDVQAMSGVGNIHVTGQYAWLNRQADLQISGTNFEIAKTRDIALTISPALNARYTDTGLWLRGELLIPEARITPIDFEQIESSSRDTVFVQGDTLISTSEDSGLAVDADIQVSLGDRVQLQAFGFSGRLNGRLRIIEQPGLPTTGVGTINVATGRYDIFGQPLDIERGSLVFTGGVINNPGLDMRVTRRIESENITVGARVSGRLREPRMSFFSNPSMQDGMILSYLVLGRAPGDGSNEQNVFAQATLALGMRGGNFLGERIGQAIGVDEVMLDATGENLENTSLFIGKHLSSRLYVRYGIGLIEPISTFFIRYRLTDRLNFESQSSGERSGADLFFTLER